MAANKYRSYDYWHHLIINHRLEYDGLFLRLPMTRESLIAHHAIVNCYGEFEAGWMVYPEVDAVLGYLEFVFLPAAFLTWCGREDERAILIPEGSAEDFVEFAAFSGKFKYLDEIPLMRETARQLDPLWLLPDQEKRVGLRAFTQILQDTWPTRQDVFFFFHLFESTVEVSEDIIKGYEEDGLLDYFEQEIGMTKEEWLHVAEQAYENEFMRHKFIDILNNRISMKI